MTIQEVWETIKRYTRRVRSNLRRLVSAGASRDGAFWHVSVFYLEIRRWRTEPVRWDIILWWPKVFVIKGDVERPIGNKAS